MIEEPFSTRSGKRHCTEKCLPFIVECLSIFANLIDKTFRVELSFE